ncbi:cytochrome c biogenesis protein/redoxin [Anaerorhabdus furcosa]|uniref:Cytochrome c-type biogenesis protein n=1 Tax=Anaerorhabdus furcosa TaxID=118967 RepID=A0A1T4L4W1_9FIRM|nr:cytochrome c biogenesis protein/redoxin [Anaerorhabdus furcosa]SJZ49653.1 cytochrome c-type biogenesis protein [Anaerorhabdus furcosa]
MGSSVTISAMFVEGVLSFFSPCVLPLIPLYIGYLTSEAKSVDENGNVVYKKSKVFFTTLFFVLGVSTVFFIAGISISAFKDFFLEYQLVLSMIGGMILIVFGCIHLNILSFPLLKGEYRLPIKLDLKSMTYVKAFLLGFFFSFAWTPCIGPMLSSALILAASASSTFVGNLYILAYAFGFIVTFLILGMFTEEVLNLLKKHQNVIKYTVKVGGAIILIMGLWMVTTSSKEIVDLQKVGAKPNAPEVNDQNETGTGKEIDAYGFTLKDQNGVEHSLKDYEGDSIFVTFFATWCTYCKQELPILQKLQNENEGMKVLVITRPGYGQEQNEASIKKFIADNGFEDMTFLFDETGEISTLYGVNSYPTSFVYRTDGTLLGYLPGAAGEDILIDILNQSKETGESK